MNTDMPTDAALKIVNHAANQSDRWIFVALLAIGIFAEYMIFRHFTAREQALEAKIDRIGNDSKEQNQQTTNRAINIMDRLEHKLDTYKHAP